MSTAHSFWLAYIKTINAFYISKFNRMGRLGPWSCSAPHITESFNVKAQTQQSMPYLTSLPLARIDNQLKTVWKQNVHPCQLL